MRKIITGAKGIALFAALLLSVSLLAAAEKTDALTVVTNRGAKKSVSPSRYGVTSRAGRGRELLKNGTLIDIIRPDVTSPEPFDEGSGDTLY